MARPAGAVARAASLGAWLLAALMIAAAALSGPAAAAAAQRRQPFHPHAKSKSAAARPAAPLSATPYMGWDTYFALGGRFSEATVLEQASELISLGLRQRGFRLVWLDVGWWHGRRGS